MQAMDCGRKESPISLLPSITSTYFNGDGAPIAQIKIRKPLIGTCVAPDMATQIGAYGEEQKCPFLHVILGVRNSNVTTL